MKTDITPLPVDGEPFVVTNTTLTRVEIYLRNALGPAYSVHLEDRTDNCDDQRIGIRPRYRSETFYVRPGEHAVKVTRHTVQIRDGKGQNILKRFNKTPKDDPLRDELYHNSDDLAHAINCLVETGTYICEPVSSNEIQFTTAHDRIVNVELPVKIIRRSRYLILVDHDGLPMVSLPIHPDHHDATLQAKDEIVLESDGTEKVARFIDKLIGWNLLGIDVFEYREYDQTFVGTDIVINSEGGSFKLIKGDKFVIRFDDSGYPLETVSDEYEPMTPELHGVVESPMESHQDDPVNHPSHYTAYNGLEIIDLTEQMNFNRGNAVKYIARAGLKGAGDKEIEDLEKAAWYINREIQRLRDESSSRVIDRTSHSEDTLARVYAVMQKECGLDSNSAERVVLSLLNKGILFRERV